MKDGLQEEFMPVKEWVKRGMRNLGKTEKITLKKKKMNHRSVLLTGVILAVFTAIPFSWVSAEPIGKPVQDVIGQVQKLWTAGQVQTALNFLEQEQQSSIRDERIHKLRGDLLMALRKNAEALAAYDQAITLAPHALVPLWAKWGLLTRMGRTPEALDVLIRLEGRDRNNPLISYRSAKDFRRVNRLDESVKAYQRAVGLAPSQLRWRLSYARALYDVLDYEQAAQVVGEVLQIAPVGSSTHAAAQNFSAVIRGGTTDKGRRSQPFENVKEAAHNNREWALTREKAWALIKSRRYQEAEPVLRKVIDLKPTNHRAYYDLGKTLTKLGRCEEAIQILETGIRLSPSGDVYPDSIFRIGQCLARLGEWAEAKKRFERVRDIESWRNEPIYSMTFPHKDMVESALDEAIRHADSAKQPSSPSLLFKPNDAAEPKSIPPPTHTKPLKAAISTPLLGRDATISRDSGRAWFQHVIPARSIERDDLQTGMHEFIPIDPGDTFHPNDQEIFLVFSSLSPSYDATQLTAEYMLDSGGEAPRESPLGRDSVVLSMNEQSGYFVLTPPEGGWPIGMYRVDLFMGDEVARSTQVDEVWFRVVEDLPLQQR